MLDEDIALDTKAKDSESTKRLTSSMPLEVENAFISSLACLIIKLDYDLLLTLENKQIIRV